MMRSRESYRFSTKSKRFADGPMPPMVMCCARSSDAADWPALSRLKLRQNRYFDERLRGIG